MAKRPHRDETAPSRDFGLREDVPALPIDIPDHKLLRRIGRGSYGEIWLAQNVLGQYRAVKVVFRSSFSHEKPYDREFHGIKCFEPISRTHEGLIDILQVGRNDAVGYFYYVMELADDASGREAIEPATYESKTLDRVRTAPNRLPIAECIRLGLSLTSAVAHLHQHSLVHRDIKPSNIIFVNGVLKLADIGLVTDIGSDTIPGGTIGYIAPEGTPTPPADIYSLGKVLYELCTGKDRQEFPELPDELGPDESWEALSEFNTILLKACAADPHQRFASMEEFLSELALLQGGKSVKRLRRLEQRLALLTKASLIVGILILVGLGAYYQVYRQRQLATERLAESYVLYGTRAMDEGDLFGSLPWFAAALQLDQDRPERAKRHRTYFSTVLRQCPRLVQMCFHSNVLNEVRFSPDSQQVLAASDAGVAELYRTRTGALLHRLAGHTQGVEDAAYSADGRYIVTASVDGTARFWDAASGQPLASPGPLRHPAKVLSARFNRQGDRVVTACADHQARIWSFPAGAPLRTLSGHTKSVRFAMFNPQGDRVATTSEDSTCRIWDAVTGQELQKVRHGNWVYQADFSPDGRHVVTGSFDKEAVIWDVATGRRLMTLRHAEAVPCVAYSPDGRYVLTGCWDFTVRMWDTATGQEAIPPLKHNSYVMSATFSPEGRRVVTSTTQGVIAIYDLAPYRWRPPTITGAINRTSRTLVSIETNGLRIQDLFVTNSTPRRVQPPHPTVQVWLTYDGDRFLTFSGNTTLSSPPPYWTQLWDAQSARRLFSPVVCSNKFLNLSPDGTRFVTANRTETRLWHLTVTNATFQVLPRTAPVTTAYFEEHGTRLATVSGTNVVLWEAPSGRRLRDLPHPHKVFQVAFSANGQLLVASCVDETLLERAAYVWNTRTGKRVGEPLRHRDGVIYSTFNRQGNLVVTAGEDSTVRIWNLDTGAATPPFEHRDEVVDATFSPDEQWLVTASRDGKARVWDAAHGLPLTPPLSHPWSLGRAQFSPDGTHILTQNASGGKWVIWHLDQVQWNIQDLVELAQLLSGRESDHVGGRPGRTRETLQDAWTDLHSRYATAFTTSSEETILWHEREAALAEYRDRPRAALFHLQILARLAKDPTPYRKRIQQLRKPLGSE